jgi:hypothetical protein
LTIVLSGCGASSTVAPSTARPPATDLTTTSPDAASPVAGTSPRPDDTTTWAPFTSERYGFSSEIPPDFGTRPSTKAWVVPESDQTSGNEWDMFGDTAHVATWSASSIRVPAGVTEEAWIEAYRQGQDDPSLPPGCNPSAEPVSPVTIDGRAGSLRLGCGELEVLVFADDRVYSFAGWTSSTTAPGVPDGFRTLFDAWLATITLDPDSALETPTASPKPS